MAPSSVWLWFPILLCSPLGCSGEDANAGSMPEQERVARWREKYVSWPSPMFDSESPGFRALMEAREAEIMQIPGSHERWENWMQFMQARILPTFTPRGFDVVKAPSGLHAALRDVLHTGLSVEDPPLEQGMLNGIYNTASLRPYFVPIPEDLDRRMRAELLPIHEEWAGGIDLVATSVYGMRAYRNQSSLSFHNDKVNTHVISSILHIDHEYDNASEPWFIEIEDHSSGELVKVDLKPGEMLLYESAKCLHGRASLLKGKYYSSVFLHYKPVQGWPWRMVDTVVAVPPHWNEGATEPKGSRWAGQSITVDSGVVEGAPPRILGGAPGTHEL